MWHALVSFSSSAYKILSVLQDIVQQPFRLDQPGTKPAVTPLAVGIKSGQAGVRRAPSWSGRLSSEVAGTSSLEAICQKWCRVRVSCLDGGWGVGLDDLKLCYSNCKQASVCVLLVHFSPRKALCCIEWLIL